MNNHDDDNNIIMTDDMNVLTIYIMVLAIIISLAAFTVAQSKAGIITYILFIVIICPLLQFMEHKLVSFKYKEGEQPFIFIIPSIYLIFVGYLIVLQHKNDYFNMVHLSFGEVQVGNLSFNLAFGLDGISLWFVVLTAIIDVLALIYIQCINQKEQNQLVVYISLISFILNIFFLSADLLLMYIAFEAVLIPLFLMIGIFGSRSRKIYASYQFFYYTVIGSIPMFVAILYIFSVTGTTLLTDINLTQLSFEEQRMLWISFAIAFAIKTPLVPVHIWLPEAHVEAPTVGSVFLAAVILKMGGYGIIRILIWQLPLISAGYRDIVITICMLSMIYAGLSALRQNDIKKIIAYSSIVHMSYATMGLFVETHLSISSSLYAMLSHGLISGGLFFCMGCLYDRYGSRDLQDYSNLIYFSEGLGVCFAILLFMNMAIPGTANFPAELGILLGMFTSYKYLTIMVGFGMLLNSAYNIWLVARLIFGPISQFRLIYDRTAELDEREISVLIPTLAFIFLMGLFPNVILSHFDLPIYFITRQYNLYAIFF